MIDIKIGSIATGATVISRMLYQVRSTRPTRDQHLKTPAIPLEMQPETDEAKAAVGFKWAVKHVPSHRGEPTWIQGDNTPVCSCGEKMIFYGQLDSVGDKICIADCGLICVFMCFDCVETKSVIQGY